MGPPNHQIYPPPYSLPSGGLPKSMLFFAHFWCRFWCRFGSHLAPILALLGAQVGPSWVQNCSCHAIFIQNVIFQKKKKTRKTNGFSRFLPPQMAPKTPQDRSKTAPRRSSRGTFSLLNISSILLRFGIDFGSLLAPILVAHKGSKIDQSTSLEPRRPQEGPRGLQEASKRPLRGAQEASKRVPRGSQEAPVSFKIF